MGATVNKLVVGACVSWCCTLVLHTGAVQMHLNMNMNVHKGRCSCHETVSGDRMRLTALGAAAGDTVVISPMPNMRPDLGRC